MQDLTRSYYSDICHIQHILPSLQNNIRMVLTVASCAAYKTRQDKTRQDKTRQDKTGQDRTRQDKTRQDKTRQDKTRQGKARQGKANFEIR